MYLTNNTLLQGGKYKIVRFISSGGFGNTYEGLDVNLNKRVAIKEFFVKDFCVREADSTRVTVTVPGKKALIEHLKHKFVEEARAIANMEHENIVDVKALFEENGTAYYVMDYIDGESVADVLKRRGSLPESKALPIILKVASALGYMHSENRFHLDVKPGNIMLRKKDGKVVLIDFGSSKQYAEVNGENTTTMAPCYTSGYAAPEQMNSKTTRYSAATDIYALGATLYKMLTGLTPPSSIDLLSKEETLSPLPEEISKSVRECVMKAMILQRVDRMQSIDEFVALLTSATDAEEKTIMDFEAERRRKEAEAKVANKRAEDAKRKAEEERKKKAKSDRSDVKKFWAILAVVGIISSIVIGIANHGGKEEGTAKKDTAAVAHKQEIQTKTFEVNGVSFDMCFVEGGTFKMGSNDPGYSDSVHPVHNVTLSSYYIGQTEVTQALWKAVMGKSLTEVTSENGWRTYGVGDKYPMYHVSWEDCHTFCKKLDSITGEKFRLPTEAEWEFAARGGNNSEGYVYSGSNYLEHVAWYYINSGGSAHPVGTKAPNELDIYDMSGNVWEWCQDWYGDYSSTDMVNPKGPARGKTYVRRGCCWAQTEIGCRSVARSFLGRSKVLDYVGLRLAL